MEAVELQNIPPISVVIWSEFVACPQIMYNLFESIDRPGGVTYHSDLKSSVKPEEVTYHSDAVYDMSQKLITSKLKVNTVDELDRLTNDLLTKPILFRTKVKHSHKVHKFTEEWKDEFAVLGNTNHSSVLEMMKQKLNEAMQLLQKNKRFCLKIDFGPSIQHWYSGRVDALPSLFGGRSSDDSGGTTIWVTNCSRPIEECYNPFCIAACFPCWLCCGPCYLINRAIKYKDLKCEFRNLGVAMVTGTLYEVLPQLVQ